MGSAPKSYKALEGGNNKEGKKHDATINPAKLQDQPAGALWSFVTEPDGTGGQKLKEHKASFLTTYFPV